MRPKQFRGTQGQLATNDWVGTSIQQHFLFAEHNSRTEKTKLGYSSINITANKTPIKRILNEAQSPPMQNSINGCFKPYGLAVWLCAGRWALRTTAPALLCGDSVHIPA